MHVVRFLWRMPSEYQVRTVSRDFGWPDREFEFFLGGRRGAMLDPELVARGQPAAFPSEPTIFILTGDTRALSGQLESHYPNGRLVDASSAPMTGVVYAFISQ
jgi:hypothetical protein